MDPALDFLSVKSEKAWHVRAECAGVNPDRFYPNDAPEFNTPAEIDITKKICADCVVRSQCLEYAITTNQKAGIWGGQTEEERASLVL